MQSTTPQPPISCKRGPAEFRPVLHLPNPPSARSTLVLTLAPGVSCSVFLSPRYTLLFLVVADAWNQDEDWNETLRGFRTKAELGERVSNPSNGNPVTEDTVRAYVREIRAAIRGEIKRVVDSFLLPEGCELHFPHLIESARMLGYRIGTCGIEILAPRTTLPATA